jgi:hypothetical protein
MSLILGSENALSRFRDPYQGDRDQLSTCPNLFSIVRVASPRLTKQTPTAWPTDPGCDSVFALIRGGVAWRANLH